jgi:hypothetical protein
MSALEPRIEALRKKYELSQDDFWQIPQNKQWVCKHAALEVIAAKEGIEWLEPKVIEADAPGLVTSMIVTGKLGERVEWATGETNPTNYSVKGKQPAYPWAMSEKRGKDRVVLKLSGVHGLLYSDAEVDASPSPADGRTEASATVGDTVARLVFPLLQSDLRASATQEQLDNAWERWLPMIVHWSDSIQTHCHDTLREMQDYMHEHGGDARDASRDMIEGELRASISLEDLDARRNKFREAFMKLGKEQKDHLGKVVTEMRAKISEAAKPDRPDPFGLDKLQVELTHEQKIAGTI